MAHMIFVSSCLQVAHHLLVTNPPSDISFLWCQMQTLGIMHSDWSTWGLTLTSPWQGETRGKRRELFGSPWLIYEGLHVRRDHPQTEDAEHKACSPCPQDPVQNSLQPAPRLSRTTSVMDTQMHLLLYDAL